MSDKVKPIVYGMIGPMGSGKTTLALQIANQKNALFQSLDGTIRNFKEPVVDLNGYEKLMPKALDLMYSRAFESLSKGQSVVFDVARWPWIYELAKETDAQLEIYYFEISTEERWRRVQKRNAEKQDNVYFWTMSKEEFDAQDPERKLPPIMPGMKLIKVSE